MSRGELGNDHTGEIKREAANVHHKKSKKGNGTGDQQWACQHRQKIKIQGSGNTRIKKKGAKNNVGKKRVVRVGVNLPNKTEKLLRKLFTCSTSWIGGGSAARRVQKGGSESRKTGEQKKGQGRSSKQKQKKNAIQNDKHKV